MDHYANTAKIDVGIKALLLPPGEVCQSEDYRGCLSSGTVHLVSMFNVGVVCACSHMCGCTCVMGLSVQGEPESDIRNHSLPYSLRQGLLTQSTAHQYGLAATQFALGSLHLCLLSLKL